VAVLLGGTADRVTLSLFTVACTLAYTHTWEGAAGPGWATFAVPRPPLASGAYFYLLEADSGLYPAMRGGPYSLMILR
jgi:hypothetical protein